MRKIVALILSAMFLFCLMAPAYAVENVTAEEAAKELNKYELFLGTGNGYELERTPTRLEALVMIIRLKGVEWWVKTEDFDNYPLYTNKHSFTDIPEWAAPYVHCAVLMGIANGISKYEFGSNQPITAAQYTTLLLRALEYDDSLGHFSWDKPWELSNHIGLTEGEYQNGDSFTRGDMALLSYKALSRCMKNSQYSLYYRSFIFQKIDNPKFPEEFWGNGEYMNSYKYDGYVDIKPLETGHCYVTYLGTETKSLSFELQDPTIASIKLSDAYSYHSDLYYYYEHGADTIRQHIEITGLKAGRTFVKVSFADDPNSHAIAFLDVKVS